MNKKVIEKLIIDLNTRLGKEEYFMQNNQTIYSRIDCKYISYDEFLKDYIKKIKQENKKLRIIMQNSFSNYLLGILERKDKKFNNLQQENEKQKQILDIIKKVFLNDYVETTCLTSEQYKLLKEWLEND